MQGKLERHCSYMTTHRMYEGRERELKFPLAVAVSYQIGNRGKSGEVVRGYMTFDVANRTSKSVERLYRKRSAIETSYRVFRQARRIKPTQDTVVWFAFALVGFVLRNWSRPGGRPAVDVDC